MRKTIETLTKLDEQLEALDPFGRLAVDERLQAAENRLRRDKMNASADVVATLMQMAEQMG